MADPGPVRRAVEIGLYRLMEASIRLLPHRLAAPIGMTWGEQWRILSPRRAGLARENLARALPELGAADHERLARACFRELGATVAETLSYGRFDPVGLCRRVTLEGWEHLTEAEGDGRGVVLLSAHVGNWEMAAQVIGLYAGPLAVVTRAMDNPLLETRIRALRERLGNRTLVKEGAVRGMIRTLREGGRVGILVDQRARHAAGILVPFLGRPAWTTSAVAAVSLRTQAPVVPAFGERLPGGRLRVHLRPPIRPRGLDRSDPEALVRLTARYLEAVGEQIKRQPECWTWMHDRWRP